MQDDLGALRALFEQEIALNGPFLPLGDLRHSSTASTEQQPAPPPASADSSIETSRAKSVDFMPNHALVEEPASPYDRIHALIPETSPLRAMRSLAEVEAYVRDTILVPVDELRTKAVFGVGNPEADLMVIGEAPGADEDLKGEPFVGRAGQLLDKILMAVKFERSEVYIANILKSRPPNNRDPLPEEVEAHIPVLYKQIALIRPRLLLLVGRTAGNGLLGRRASLASFRSQIHDFHGLPVIVTYHPAALLRNPQWKRPTWEDVQLLRTHYDELAGAAPAC